MIKPDNSTQRYMRKRRKEDRRIAYFSMEVGLDAKIPTYSGGLGILAGDTIKSCADLNVPLVAVTLLYRDGYFDQKLDAQGLQTEHPCQWHPDAHMTLLPERITVTIENRTVVVQAWMYTVNGAGGYFVPVIFLDTDVEGNAPFDCSLTHRLYGDDDRYRLAQEIVLGIGGVRMLKELGFESIARYHMNEGHASLLTLELLRQIRISEEGTDWDAEAVRRMCVFTTHTPVPAGHDQFYYDLVHQVLGDFVPFEVLQELAGKDKLNMTLLALNLSDYINGVAKEHGKVSREMFPGYHIDFITNGVHSSSWVSESFKKLFDKYIPGWINDNFTLRYALSIPKDEIWQAHQTGKSALIRHLVDTKGVTFEQDVLTIGFARRATAYKRADLLFYDINRLRSICASAGKVQFVFAGKAHPKDWNGKELIKRIHAVSGQLGDSVKIVYLENYDAHLAKMLISGVDVWLNTPRRPQEASGTSGMKAAHNGIPSLSILDGWWIEGCIENLTGWSIGSIPEVSSSDEKDAVSLYDKLEKAVIPAYYHNRDHWIDIMRNCIAINASFFNTHRMVQQYVLNAYSY